MSALGQKRSFEPVSPMFALHHERTLVSTQVWVCEEPESAIGADADSRLRPQLVAISRNIYVSGFLVVEPQRADTHGADSKGAPTSSRSIFDGGTREGKRNAKRRCERIYFNGAQRVHADCRHRPIVSSRISTSE